MAVPGELSSMTCRRGACFPLTCRDQVYEAGLPSLLGRVDGSGAIDNDGTLYWGTRARNLKVCTAPNTEFDPDADDDALYEPFACCISSTDSEPGFCNFTGTSSLLALDAASGTKDWSVDLPFGTSGTPLVTENFV